MARLLARWEERTKMSVKWTTQQQKVIDLRDRNILVSAAAGSGKTAVLVERILTRIAKDEHKIDIDKLLIVTFTNAAAAEMRERIRDALEKELELHPEDDHLQKQITLIHHAQITTIDSFCLYVIRNYFHTIDLEPNFRVADEGELALLKADVLDFVLEQYYEEKSEAFLQFMEAYSGAKNDNAIRDMVINLYQYSQSYPWPMEWLDSCSAAYHVCDFKEFSWIKEFLTSIQSIFADLKNLMLQALSFCRHPDGPNMYEPAILDDIVKLEELEQITSYEMFYEKLNEFTGSFAKLAAARKFDGDENLKELVKTMRDDMKKAVKDCKEKYFFKEPKKMLSDLAQTAPYADILLQITRTFIQKLEEEKKKKNLLDFSDMEHFALKILIHEDTKEPTEAAMDFARLFEEIMIDEYQDSNYVQETILRAISKERLGTNNLFMVGDVKQSIYRFRLARPELFMEKYHSYSFEDAKEQRIDLHMNFRSRSEVLNSVNDIFYKIMDQDLGNIVYDDNASLHPGAAFQELPYKEPAIEIIVVTQQEEEQISLLETDEDLIQNSFDKPELEAFYIAGRIKELIKASQVTDKKTGELRPAEYNDIVILLRSVSGYADTFVKILLSEGVPAYTISKTGYFSTIEIQTILNLLRVIDNPMQDIPLTAVLRSPFCNFSGEELAKIRILGDQFTEENRTFYDCVFALKNVDKMQVSEENLFLCEKTENFFLLLNTFRSRVSYTPVHELLQQILNETGYMEYIWALPAGEQKRANVQMLIERAIDYENTSYKGLFHFVQYIEKLQKYDVDYGEADTLSENANAVSVMSIHKSKGLEFPIVFVSGMGKSFNMQDTRGKLVLHPDYGMGMDYVNLKKRTKTPTFYKRILAKNSNEETKGEELRILYVALTRAKEKLILTGYLKDASEKIMAYKAKANTKGPLSYLTRSKATSYWDWILPAIYSYENRYEAQIYIQKQSKEREIAEQIENALKKEQFMQYANHSKKDVDAALEEQLSYQYPYSDEQNIKTKVSVSELKSRAYIKGLPEEEQAEDAIFLKEVKEEYIPDFIETVKEERVGAMRGSAVHLFMQCVSFEEAYNILSQTSLSQKEKKDVLLTFVNHAKEELKTHHKLDDVTYELIWPGIIVDFLLSPLAFRMMKAARNGALQKEKAFVLGIPAKEIENCNSEELVLVQGIVDAFFVEEDEIIIMDYKTDRIFSEEEFLMRYKEQLDLYAKALSLATGKKVREKIIYSFTMKKEIRVL